MLFLSSTKTHLRFSFFPQEGLGLKFIMLELGEVQI